MRISDWSSDVCSSDLEVLHRVVGKERLHLGVELRGESLVGRQDQRGPLQLCDRLGGGEGLAGAGDAEQHLVALALQQSLGQLADGLRLVARRSEEHTSELQSLMRISYAVFCLK